MSDLIKSNEENAQETEEMRVEVCPSPSSKSDGLVIGKGQYVKDRDDANDTPDM